MKHIKNTILALVAILMLSACNDWLNLEPTDGVPRDKYWQSKEDVHTFMNGIYISMRDNVSNMWTWGEWRTDEITNSQKIISSDMQAAFAGEFSSTMSRTRWNTFYATINYCNTLLHFAPQAQANDESFSSRLLDEYMAQAIAIRSLMYFYLVRTFRDVPYTEEAYIDDISQDFTLPKTAGDAILDNVIEDLKWALDKAPFSYSNADQAQNKGRVTAWFVRALLADIYLWKEKYDDVIPLCNDLINSGQFALLPVLHDWYVYTDVVQPDGSLKNDTVRTPDEGEVATLFDALYVTGNSAESIFEVQYDVNTQNPFYGMMSGDEGYLYVNMDNLSENFFPEGRYAREFDWRKLAITKTNLIWKFVGKAYQGNTRGKEEYTGNYIVYRLGEIYLMKAEALIQQAMRMKDDDSEGAQELYKQAIYYINVIRERANAPSSTELTYGQAYYDGPTMEQYILEERGRELFTEGKRWYDVLRSAKRNNFARLDFLTTMAMYSAPPEKLLTLQTKYKNPDALYLPINLQELEKNPALVQNPFYAAETTIK